MVANEEQPRTVLRKSVRLQGRQESEKKEGEEDQKRGIGKASKGKPTKGESVSKPEGGTSSLSEKEEQQEEKASIKGEGRYLNDCKALALLYCTYRICSIRHRGYYLFHHAILCGFYSRAATHREWRLLNSVLSVKIFHKCEGLRKVSFIRLTKNCDAAT